MKQKQAFSSTLSVNPYNNTYYTGTATRIKVADKPQYQKDQYTVSCLNTHDFITTMISISKKIPDEDIADAVETKIYEELGLDMAVEYQINYVSAADGTDEANNNYHVFVVDPLSMEEAFGNTIEQIKYIDQITPVPLLLRTLYKKEIIEENGTHCFIYFQSNDAFLTLYNDREFLYTKSLKFSFSRMHDRYCELMGEQMELGSFIRLLCEEGLQSIEGGKQQYLMKLFGEVFLHINDVITYSKRAFELDHIDKVYIGSEAGAIIGMDEYSQTYLGLDSSDFNFNYGFETEEWYIDQLHLLMQLTIQLEAEDRYECNFTRFHRPPQFVKRASGQLILTVAASAVVALLYPGIYWTLDGIESIRKAAMSAEYDALHIERLDRENQLKYHTTEMEKVKKLVENEQASLDEKKAVLTQIHNVKVDYPMKAKLISDLTKDLNKYQVKLEQLGYSEDAKTKEREFTLNLLSSQDKRITNLIEWYTKTRSAQYKFSIKNIEFDEEKKIYSSELKVVLK